ncbi:Gasdermin-D [Trichuris trichiura]|uniref:Gasdermin-D n=80 Tax=cellular organisms TaxID=131567 RepID=A0A077ZJH0_TRITR|nr:Gasdermin-D [Trichuris trichiura]
MTSLLAHRSAAVFHDGIRPILPQLIEGYMNRREAGSIAFGLSIGFVASVGISFTLKTGLLNAWLLFLPTDILGVLAINSLMAFGLGAIWGVLILTCLLPVNQLLTALPVDVLGSLGELSSPVVSAFALFPLVAIFYQFGWKQSLIAAVVVLMTRVVVVRYFPHLNPESIEIFIGMVMLLGIAITHDLRHRDENDIDASGLSVFEERTSRIIKNLPYIAIVGALIAAVASMKIFAGSEVSIFTLEKAYSAGVTPEQSQTLINQAALAEFMRGLGFVPLIATTALATGVYAVAGFTFVYAVGYLSPNPMVAAVLGAVVISAEVLLLRSIGKWLGRYPSVRNASDNIRNAMNMLMEVALLVGSIFAAIKMAGYTGFSIAVAIYFLNESLGRPVQKMAAPVVAVMITGILLNVLYWLGLLTIIEAQQKQFALVDSICRHFPGSEFLTGGDLGLTPGLNQPRVTQRVEQVLADAFHAQAAALVQGAGTGAIRAGLAALLKPGQRLLVHDAPVYPTTRVIIEQMGLTLITVDFNDLSALKQVVDEQQPDAALVQHTRQQPQDSYVLADVLATLRAAGVPALTDDNYAVMKVARIGCECGANVSTFSCFKLFGPEGVGAVVGDADVINRIRATLYSGGSQIQGAQALEVLRGLVFAPVMHAVQAGVSERLLALLNGGAVPEVKSAVIANAQSKVLIVEFHQPIAARVLEEAQKRGALPYPVGAESKYEIPPLFYRLSGTFRQANPQSEHCAIRINPNRSGEETVLRILRESIASI